TTPEAPTFDAARLNAVLGAQPEAAKARYGARHPADTLAFFGLTPGMTVVEALPGGGWYSKILIDYLGPQGELVGADYALSMWPKFGFFDNAFVEQKKTWTTDWPAQAAEWRSAGSAPISAFVFNELPASRHGTADAVLFVRALHNFARFNDDGGYLDSALGEAFAVLKPGGIVGVVQHEARDDMSDAFATGARGYLKKAYVIQKMREAGFEYVGSRDINANPNDRPTEDDIVWRLPPSLVDSREDPVRRDQMLSIGESHRMTLKFRKPR
ncbi:MAG: methyltransferase, partial [Pseudomonadota bacterium]